MGRAFSYLREVHNSVTSPNSDRERIRFADEAALIVFEICMYSRTAPTNKKDFNFKGVGHLRDVMRMAHQKYVRLYEIYPQDYEYCVYGYNPKTQMRVHIPEHYYKELKT
jgi:hypothetical protein